MLPWEILKICMSDSVHFLGFKRHLKQNWCLKLVKYFLFFSDLGGGWGQFILQYFFPLESVTKCEVKINQK